MARERGPRALHEVLDAAGDVLAGRVRLEASALARLIREVNPSGRGVPADQERERYRLKSGLQALLLRDHAERVRIAQEPGRDGVVLLTLVPGGEDACHVPLDELEPAARSLVRLRLDLGEVAARPDAPGPARSEPAAAGARADPSPEPAPPPDEPPEATRLLEEGRRALAAFDFDRARACLTDALRASGGAPDAAAALLELLVDTLADDAGALGVRPSLSRAAAGDDRVRSLLAVAAARMGDRSLAERLATGATVPQGAVALVLLARAALGEGALGESLRLVALARDRDAAHPELTAIEREVRALGSAAARPAEEELARLVAAGEWGEAERLAAELRRRYPQSVTARLVEREVERRRRNEAAQAELAQARSALEAGDATGALAHAERAAAAGAGVEELRSIREPARALAARSAREGRLAAVGAELGRDARAGLLRYLALDAQERAAVRVGGERPELAWLEELAPAREGARARAAVDAVLALGRARAVLARGDEAAALGALEGHDAALGRLGEARELRTAARAAQAVRLEADAREGLGRAERALLAGDLAAAEAELDGLRTGPIRAGVREELGQASAACRERLRAARVEAEIVALRAAGRALEALTIAARTPAAGEDPARAARLEDLRAAASRDCRRVVAEQPGLPLGLDPGLLDARSGAEHVAALGAGGETLVVAQPLGPCLFAWLVEVSSGRVQRAVSLLPPGTLRYASLCVSGSRAWVTGSHGGMLELGLPALEPCSWTQVLPEERRQDSLERVLVLAAADRMWLEVRGIRRGTHRAVVVRPEQSKAAREVPLEGPLQLVPGPEPLVAGLGLDHGGLLFEPHGAVAARLRLALPLTAVARDPRGEGFVALARDFVGSLDSALLVLVELDARGAVRRRHELPGARAGEPHALVTSRACRCAFVLHGGDAGQRLLGFATRAGSLEPVWAIGAQGAALATDEAGEHAVLSRPATRGFQALRLGEEEPVLAPPAGPALERLPPLDPLFPCAGPAEEGPWTDLRSRAEARLRARYLDELDGVLAAADEVARRAGRLRHLQHLRGIAGFRRGDLAGAEAAWLAAPAPRPSGRERKRERDADDCDLEACLELVHPLAPEPSPGESLAVRLRRLAAAADRAAAEEGPAAAVTVLDVPDLWRARELQTLARLCDAWLALDPDDPAARLRKTYALAAFLDAFGPGSDRAEVVTGAGWRDWVALEGLARRALEWLGAAPGEP